MFDLGITRTITWAGVLAIHQPINQPLAETRLPRCKRRRCAKKIAGFCVCPICKELWRLVKSQAQVRTVFDVYNLFIHKKKKEKCDQTACGSIHQTFSVVSIFEFVVISVYPSPISCLIITKQSYSLVSTIVCRHSGPPFFACTRNFLHLSYHRL